MNPNERRPEESFKNYKLRRKTECALEKKRRQSFMNGHLHRPPSLPSTDKETARTHGIPKWLREYGKRYRTPVEKILQLYKQYPKGLYEI